MNLTKLQKFLRRCLQSPLLLERELFLSPTFPAFRSKVSSEIVVFSLISSDSFSLESPAASCRTSFLGVVYEDKKKSDAHPALDPNIVENESLDNVELHDGQAGPDTAAAGVVYVAASTCRQGW